MVASTAATTNRPGSGVQPLSLRSGLVGFSGKKGMYLLHDLLEQIVKGLDIPCRTVRKRDQGNGVNFQHRCKIFDFADRRGFQAALEGADVCPPADRLELFLT